MSKADDQLAREITPRRLYLNRRQLMRGGLLAATAAATGGLYRLFNGVDLESGAGPRAAIDGLLAAPHDPATGFWTHESPTSRSSITHYNNFYEFSTDKDGVAEAAADFRTDDWQLAVGGLVHKPAVFDLDMLRAITPPVERVYRMRCVEAWSMVIPWAGLPLAALLAKVEPMSSARYVAFETLHDPARMPNQQTKVLDWPYVEGLRIDEAMHPLTLLATGLYGEVLPPQDGAPVRLVVPWKYGFKGIKSIVKITLTDRQPPSTWQRYGPDEYGFYANVNPRHAHPRWSQATEQRIGETERRPTLMFNGYADQVAGLYAGMDLDAQF